VVYAIPPSPLGWSIRVKSLVLALGYLLMLSAVYGAFTVYLVRRETSEAQDRFRQTRVSCISGAKKIVIFSTLKHEILIVCPSIWLGVCPVFFERLMADARFFYLRHRFKAFRNFHILRILAHLFVYLVHPQPVRLP